MKKLSQFEMLERLALVLMTLPLLYLLSFLQCQ